MLADLLTRLVTIAHRTAGTATDDYGNQDADEATVETVGELQQRQRTEDPGQGETSDSLSLLILPAGTAIGTADVVTVDGLRFEVVGDPWPVRNPRTGQDSHIEATLRRTAGAGDNG